MSAVALGVVVAAVAAGAAWLWLWAGGGLDPQQRRVVGAMRKLPGPVRIPVLGTAYKIITLGRAELMPFFDRVTKEYWPIFRTFNGPLAEVQLSEAHHVEVIFRCSTNIEKGDLYKHLQPWLGTGLLTSTGKKWFSHRKLITPTFHFNILETFQEVFAERSLELVRCLEKEASNEKGFDMYPYITLCALDIICETAMGTQINAQRVRHSTYVDAIYDASELTMERALRPWLRYDFLYFLTKNGKRYRQCLDTLHGFTNKVIAERKSKMGRGAGEGQAPTADAEDPDGIGRKKRKAFLDLLLEANEKRQLLTDEEIREEVDTFMFEGHDTTSASLCWTLFLLGHNSKIQERVFEEQEAIFGASERLPTMHDLSQMKYLERVIKESLRLYPSVPFIIRKLTKDITVGDYLLPAGTQANIHIYHVHRNPKYFPDPETFDPDNFLPEKTHGRHPYAYVPFSAGSRNCIGQKFALLEEKTVLSTVLRHFRVRSLEKPEEVKVLAELVLRPEKGIRMAVERRE